MGGIALGYEALHDHDALRGGSLLALWAGKADPTGARRPRERDRGYALAGSSTLNRLELSRPEAAARDRYRRMAADADADAMDRVLVDLFLDAHTEAPEELWLDLDATDDPLHGGQAGRFLHGYYQTYCYLPLYIFCGEHLLCAWLRPSNRDASAGSVEELSRIVNRLRQRWPQVRVVVRGDAGFCREPILRWWEDHDVDDILGLARNEHLVGRIGKALRKSRSRAVTGVAAFPGVSLPDPDLLEPRAPGGGQGGASGEGTQPALRGDPPGSRGGWAAGSTEQLYCARGDMENRIQECQLDLFADRTSTATLHANQLRRYFASFAYALMHGLRHLGLAGTRWAQAQCGTLRVQLLKVAARVRITARKVWLSFSSVYPYQDAFTTAAVALCRDPPRAPPA